MIDVDNVPKFMQVDERTPILEENLFFMIPDYPERASFADWVAFARSVEKYHGIS